MCKYIYVCVCVSILGKFFLIHHLTNIDKLNSGRRTVITSLDASESLLKNE